MNVKTFLLLAAILALSVLVASCGGDDDDAGDDTQAPEGTCSSYCEKVISCGDQSWDNVDECAQNCESAPKRDCYLNCSTSLKCGDFMDCLSGC